MTPTVARHHSAAMSLPAFREVSQEVVTLQRSTICVITRDPCISKDRDGGMAALMTVCVMMPTLADTLAMTSASDSPVSPPLAVWRSTQPILAVENPTV